MTPEALERAARMEALRLDLARAERDNSRLVAALVAVREAVGNESDMALRIDGAAASAVAGIETLARSVRVPLSAVADLLPSPLDGDGHPAGWDAHHWISIPGAGQKQCDNPAHDGLCPLPGWESVEADPDGDRDAGTLRYESSAKGGTEFWNETMDSRPVCGCGSPDHERPNSRYQPERGSLPHMKGPA